MTSAQKLHQLRAISTFLDSQFKGPFGLRFGMDAIIGLIPFLGDLTTTIFSLYILTQSAALGCSTATIMRMAINIGFDNLISAIPLFGNIFDFMWKANSKNILLLEAHLNNPKAVSNKSRFIIAAVIMVLLALLIFTGLVTFYMVSETLYWLRDLIANDSLAPT